MNASSEPMSNCSRICVAAIELGPSQCGCAFSFKHSWRETMSRRHLLHITSTSLLLNPDRTLKAFGHQADEEHLRLIEDAEDECENYYYFQDFLKQNFEVQNFIPEFKVHDINQKEVEISLLLHETLKFFVDEIMTVFGNQSFEMGIQDVDFVIVIPGTCKNEVINFLRRIAIEVGIRKDGLSFLSSMHAVSLFAQHVGEDACDSSIGFQWNTLEDKDVYLTVHFGEDATIVNKHIKFEKGIDPVLKSITFAVGSSSILSELLTFLIDALGTDVIEEFKRDFSDDYKSTIDEFMRKIIHLKCSESTRKMTTRIPPPLKSITRRIWGEDMSSVLKKRIMDGSITEVQCKVQITQGRIHRLCKSTVERIVKELEVILKQEGAENVKRLFLFGELASAEIFQTIIREKMPGSRFYFPTDALNVILKGGVYCGHVDNTRNVVAKGTFKVQVCKMNDASKYPIGMEDIMNEEGYHVKHFITFLEKGDTIQEKGTITKRIELENPEAGKFFCFIVSSGRKINVINLPFPSPPQNHHVYEETEFTMTFDSPSLSVEARHVYKSESFKMFCFEADCF